MNDRGFENLKIWPDYFKAVWDGDKTFELRETKNRDFQVGTRIRLLEWNPERKEKTGSYILGEIKYVLNGPKWGLKEGWCIFTFEVKHKIK